MESIVGIAVAVVSTLWVALRIASVIAAAATLPAVLGDCLRARSVLVSWTVFLISAGLASYLQVKSYPQALRVPTWILCVVAGLVACVLEPAAKGTRGTPPR
jgi:hypothetical protein